MQTPFQYVVAPYPPSPCARPPKRFRSWGMAQADCRFRSNAPPPCGECRLCALRQKSQCKSTIFFLQINFYLENCQEKIKLSFSFHHFSPFPPLHTTFSFRGISIGRRLPLCGNRFHITSFFHNFSTAFASNIFPSLPQTVPPPLSSASAITAPFFSFLFIANIQNRRFLYTANK